MAPITLAGPQGPEQSFLLDRDLDPLTRQLRLGVVVDLTGVTELHPAVVSVLITHQQRSARLGGELVVRPPASVDARRIIDQIGLCRVASGGAVVTRAPRPTLTGEGALA